MNNKNNNKYVRFILSLPENIFNYMENDRRAGLYEKSRPRYFTDLIIDKSIEKNKRNLKNV